MTDRRAAGRTDSPEQVAASADGLFVWDRTPPPEWVERLNRLAPPSDQMAHYRLVWEPGDAIMACDVG